MVKDIQQMLKYLLKHNFLQVYAFCIEVCLLIKTSDAKVIQLKLLPFISFSGSTATEGHFAHHTEVLLWLRLNSTMITRYDSFESSY